MITSMFTLSHVISPQLRMELWDNAGLGYTRTPTLLALLMVCTDAGRCKNAIIKLGKSDYVLYAVWNENDPFNSKRFSKTHSCYSYT